MHRDRAPFGAGSNANMPHRRGPNTDYSRQGPNIGFGDFLEKMFLRRIVALMQKDAIMVFLGHFTIHRSREKSPNVRDEGLQGR